MAFLGERPTGLRKMIQMLDPKIHRFGLSTDMLLKNMD